MSARGLGLGLVVCAGMLALALTGAVVGRVALVGLAVCALAPWLRASLRRMPWPAGTVAMAVWAGWALQAGWAGEEVLAVALVYLQVHRRLARTTDRDDRVSTLVAGLMLVASSSSTTDPLFAAAAGAWALGLPLALLPSAPSSARADGVGLAAAAVAVPLSVVLFWALPRFTTDGGPGAAGLTGFSPDLELGAMDVLLDDPAVVFRAALSRPVGEPLYFRGVALDRFDGNRWTTTSDPRATQLQSAERFPPDSVAIDVQLLDGGGVLFTAGQVLHIRAEGELSADDQGAWFAEDPQRYAFIAAPPWDALPADPLDDAARTRFTSLPVDLDPRIAEAARTATADAEPTRKARAEALLTWLRTDFTYTRAPRDADAEAPLSEFLFEHRAGHCEYFASSLTVLARSLGMPARLVNGFVGGEVDPATGELVMRRYHAHSWTEVYLEGRGWVQLDATPGPGAPPPARGGLAWRQTAADAWQRWVLSFDRSAQQTAVLGAGRQVERLLPQRTRAAEVPWTGLAILWLSAFAVAAAARLVLSRVAARLAGDRPAVRGGPVLRAHARARRQLAHAGWSVPGSLPPLAAARWIRERAPDEEAAHALEELAWLVYRVRYGGDTESPLVSRARELAEHAARLGPPREHP